ncbi:hypothetical protein L2E82_19147 [Cichorium intybus]|uniref:Uncharacterized protein n=1 Tax=Cichorium intybus TaxID=13427 RepID=A0ACB9FAS1_CICIN|nr:hypothetical protein L2E82_19147 [Cichorium intybus]
MSSSFSLLPTTPFSLYPSGSLIHYHEHKPPPSCQHLIDSENCFAAQLIPQSVGVSKMFDSFTPVVFCRPSSDHRTRELEIVSTLVIRMLWEVEVPVAKETTNTNMDKTPVDVPSCSETDASRDVFGRKNDFAIVFLSWASNLHIVKEHLLIVCELLKANLYEFHKFNREYGGEVYFTMPRLQNDSPSTLLARVIGIIIPIGQDMLVKGRDTNKYFFKNQSLFYDRNQDTNELEYPIPKKTFLRHHLLLTNVRPRVYRFCLSFT